MDKLAIVIIPAYNPTNDILPLIKELSKSMEIICINDGSKKECESIFAEIKSMEKVHLLQHAVNMGKGRALKTGFDYALNEFPGADMVVTVDADGQHKIEDIVKICDAYNASNEVILGKRDFESEEIPLRSRFGNKMTKIVFSYLCGIKLSDTQTGLRVYPLQILPELLKVSGDRYEYETNVLLWCHDNDIQFREITIQTVYENGNAQSHFNPIKDSLKIYGVILKYIGSSLLAVFVDNLVFMLLSEHISNYFVLTYIGRAFSATVNFSVNKKIVFKKQGNMGMQALRYIILLIFSGTLSALSVKCLVSKMDWALLPTKLLVETILFFFNYYMQNKFVFGKGNK